MIFFQAVISIFRHLFFVRRYFTSLVEIIYHLCTNHFVFTASIKNRNNTSRPQMNGISYLRFSFSVAFLKILHETKGLNPVFSVRTMSSHERSGYLDNAKPGRKPSAKSPLTVHNGTKRGLFVIEKQLCLVQNKILHKPLQIMFFNDTKYI